MRNQRRAYDNVGAEFPPMTLENLRQHGPQNVMVECHACKREASLNVDALPGEVPVPDVAIVLTKLVCSGCAPAVNLRTTLNHPEWPWTRARGRKAI